MKNNQNPQKLRIEFESRRPTFQRAAENIAEAISLLLERVDLKPLAVTQRVKTFGSFAEKVTRKNYDKPFEQNTDFVGIRVICYLPHDADAAVKTLKKEFDVIESINKSESLEPNEFGYRSHHLLLKVPSTWENTPNYQGLRGTPIEVQIRTLMMHAWAEIEHKLQYKSTSQVPRELQRKLFLLSGKVEEVDSQFQELVSDVTEYRKRIAEAVAKKGDFDTSLELNLDTFKELLEFFYPGKAAHAKMTQNLYEEVVKQGLTLPDLVNIAKDFKPLEKLLSKLVPDLAAAAYFGYALDVVKQGFTKSYNSSERRLEIIGKLKEKYII